MIQPQELRLGNWVYMSKDGVTINVKVEPSILMILTGKVDKKGIEINPIPLTEEILLKCGFDTNIDIYYTSKLNGYFKKPFIEADYFLYKSPTGDKLTSVKHLHQLQNLFHSLTGTELEIKHPPY